MKETGKFTYHVTKIESLESILMSGLIPQIGERSQRMDESPAVFMFNDKKELEDGLMNWLFDEFEDDELVILELDASKIKVRPSTVEFEVISLETITPDTILGIYDDAWQLIDHEFNRSSSKKIIEIAKNAIESGLARTSLIDQQGHSKPAIRFILSQTPDSDQPQYIGSINSKDEPAEVSIARRLISGHLNMPYIRQEADPKVIAMMERVTLIREHCIKNGISMIDEFELSLPTLYSKTVEIYKLDEMAPDQDLVWKAKAGNADAVKILDSQGYYQKEASIEAPNTFDLQKTLQAVGEHKGVVTGDVVRVDEKSYVNNSGLYSEITEFSGVGKPEAPRLKERKAFNLSDLLTP